MTDMTEVSGDVDLTGVGDHRPDHRRGFLVFTCLPDALQRAEDSTAYADYENRGWGRKAVVRPATAAEKTLLAHVLGRPVRGDLQTHVRWVSDGVRNRSWPQLNINEQGVQTP